MDFEYLSVEFFKKKIQNGYFFYYSYSTKAKPSLQGPKRRIVSLFNLDGPCGSSTAENSSSWAREVVISLWPPIASAFLFFSSRFLYTVPSLLSQTPFLTLQHHCELSLDLYWTEGESRENTIFLGYFFFKNTNLPAWRNLRNRSY